MAEGHLAHWITAVASAFGLGFLIGKLTSYEFKLRKQVKETNTLSKKKEAQEARSNYFRSWYRRFSHTATVTALITGASVALYIAKPEARDYSSKVALAVGSVTIFSYTGSRVALHRHKYYEEQAKQTDLSLKVATNELKGVIGKDAASAVN